MKKIAIGIAILLAGCSAKTPSDPVAGQSDPQTDTQMAAAGTQEPDNQADVAPQDYAPPVAQPVVSVYIDPPLAQPQAVSVAWAPPPMLVDEPTPQPADNQVWVGGYWVWEGDWVWASGNWAPPPRPGYQWNNPYYEHRGDSVVFVNGYWGAPGTSFVPPPLGVDIALGVIGVGVIAGMRPHGPEGVFVPAPPGSYRGLIVPAPIGTAPAVVVGAAPIVRTGMRVTINNQRNVTHITNETNVTVIAPANAMANGKAVNVSVPVQPHLAAAQSAVVNARAPEPASDKHIPAYVAGHKPIALPTAQEVHPEVPTSLVHTHANTSAAAENMPTHPIAPQPAHLEPERVEHPHPTQPAVTPHQPVAEARPEPRPESKPEPKPEPRQEPHAAPPEVREVPRVPEVAPAKMEAPKPAEHEMQPKPVPAKSEKRVENKPAENNGHE